SRVDQHGTAPEPAQRSRVDHVPGLRRTGSVQGDEVAVFEQLVEPRALACTVTLENGGLDQGTCINEYLHAETAVRAPRDRPADAPEADQPERLPAHLLAEKLQRLPAAPASAADE